MQSNQNKKPVAQGRARLWRGPAAFLPTLLLLAASQPLLAQTAEGPVGLLTAAGPQSKIIRRDSSKPVPARVGEMLFAGDRLLAGTEPVSYLFCPSRSLQTLDRQAEALFQPAEVKVPKGKIVSQKQVGSCLLPQKVQLSLASQQKVGALVMRGVELKLLSPVGGPALETQPKFAWQPQPAKEASSYEIEVANSEGRVLWKTRLSGTEAQYPPHAPPLIGPATYSWKVTALADGKATAATESTFQLLTTAERLKMRQDLERVSGEMKQDPSNPALRVERAAMLEQAKLAPAALEEYRALAATWKDTVWLQAKVADLEQALASAQRNAMSNSRE